MELDWTEWQPIADAVRAAPREAGVYMARTGDRIVYIGRAGDRRGSGVAGRLNAYATGKSPDSGLVGKATDRALADPAFVGKIDQRLREGRPWTLRQLAVAAIEHLGVEFRSAPSPESAWVERELIARHAELWNLR